MDQLHSSDDPRAPGSNGQNDAPSGRSNGRTYAGGIPGRHLAFAVVLGASMWAGIIALIAWLT